MAKVAHARTVSLHAPNEIADLIRARAQNLGISDSKYLLGIVKQWESGGCPPISALDAAAQEIAAKRKADAS